MGVKHPCLPESQFIHHRIYTEDLLGGSCHPRCPRYKSDPKEQDFCPLTVYNLMQQSTDYVHKGPASRRGGSVVKSLPVDAGDAVCHPWVGRSPGEGNGNPLQYSCLGNPMDRRAWWVIVSKESRQNLLDPQSLKYLLAVVV